MLIETSLFEHILLSSRRLIFGCKYLCNDKFYGAIA